MPTFDYECNACGHVFELLLLSSSPLPSCPSCGSGDLLKKLSAPAVTSDSTRRRSRHSARARGDQTRKDWTHEEHRRLHDHDHDH